MNENECPNSTGKVLHCFHERGTGYFGTEHKRVTNRCCWCGKQTTQWYRRAPIPNHGPHGPKDWEPCPEPVALTDRNPEVETLPR